MLKLRKKKNNLKKKFNFFCFLFKEIRISQQNFRNFEISLRNSIFKKSLKTFLKTSKQKLILDLKIPFYCLRYKCDPFFKILMDKVKLI